MSAFDHDDAERRARIDLLLLDIEARIVEIAATRGSVGQIAADTAVAREEVRYKTRLADYEPWKMVSAAMLAGAAVMAAVVGLLTLILRH